MQDENVQEENMLERYLHIIKIPMTLQSKNNIIILMFRFFFLRNFLSYELNQYHSNMRIKNINRICSCVIFVHDS